MIFVFNFINTHDFLVPRNESDWLQKNRTWCPDGLCIGGCVIVDCEAGVLLSCTLISKMTLNKSPDFLGLYYSYSEERLSLIWSPRLILAWRFYEKLALILRKLLGIRMGKGSYFKYWKSFSSLEELNHLKLFRIW